MRGRDGIATAATLREELGSSRGSQVPWVLVRDALTDALTGRQLELAPESAPWPASPEDASSVRVRVPSHSKPTPDQPYLDPAELVGDVAQTVWERGTPTLRAIKEAIERYRGAKIDNAVFEHAAQAALDRGLIAFADGPEPLSATLNTRVRLPDITLFAEAQLSPREIIDFAEIVQDVIRTAPELSFAFRVNISAEGAKPAPEIIAALNELLARVSRRWKLE